MHPKINSAEKIAPITIDEMIERVKVQWPSKTLFYGERKSFNENYDEIECEEEKEMTVKSSHCSH